MISLHTESKEIGRMKCDALVAFIPTDEKSMKTNRRRLESLLGTSVSKASIKDIRGTTGETYVLYTPESFASPRMIITGIGKDRPHSLEDFRKAAANAAKQAKSMKLGSIAFILDQVYEGDLAAGESVETVAAAIAEGAALGTYVFSKYLTGTETGSKTLKSVTLLAPSKKTAGRIDRAARRAVVISDAVYLARDLGNTPGLDLYPETLAATAATECRKAGCKVTVFDERKITSLKMGGILSVSKGSERPPRFIIIEWNGGRASDKPYVLVGKGITFDTGGISIKPSANMGAMKMDMSGAAAVIGTLKAAARLRLPVNVVGLIPASENMVSGRAIRPGDVIRIMDGKTVEVDNTDAEGRLVLADALVYAKRYKPKGVVDLATLTGACVVALGHYASGMMGNDSDMMASLKKAGERTYERVWELPLYEEYEKMLKSDIADIKNIGGRWAGAITAGWFLKKFAKDFPWVHLDIAGTAMLEENTEYTQRGASGVGVRLLTEWLASV
jgi:leucyl aminopeptidase